MENQFSEKYKTLNIAKLLEIIYEPQNYRQEAIEAAKSELNLRNLSTEQLAKAEQAFIESKAQQNDHKQKLVQLENKAGNTINAVLNDINFTKPKSPERSIRIICVILGATLLYNIFTNRWMLISMFSELESWDISVIIWLFPYIYLPVAIYLFYEKRKSGWIMFCAWLTFTIVTAIFAYIIELKMAQTQTGGLYDIINVLSPQRGVAHYTLIVLIFGGLLYYINTSQIKGIFNIQNPVPIVTIAFTAMVVCFQWSFVFS